MGARGGAAGRRPSRPAILAEEAGGTRAALVALALVLVAGAALYAADAPVTGTYTGNGKPAKLAYVRVLKADPWQGEPSYTLVISERDASKIAKPDMDALFGKLGDALIINVTQSGALFGTQVCHQALEKAGFSTSGSIKVEGFSIKDGTLSGRFYTEGEEEFFGETWKVDLKVSGKLP